MNFDRLHTALMTAANARMREATQLQMVLEVLRSPELQAAIRDAPLHTVYPAVVVNLTTAESGLLPRLTIRLSRWEPLPAEAAARFALMAEGSLAANRSHDECHGQLWRCGDLCCIAWLCGQTVPSTEGCEPFLLRDSLVTEVCDLSNLLSPQESAGEQPANVPR